MMSNSEFGSISFDLPKPIKCNQSNGVGGGGSNAINHMFKQGIKGVDFIVCNTDSQAYKVVQFPIKFSWCELKDLQENPDVGQQSAGIAEIEKMLDRNTKMVLSLQGWVVVPVQVRLQ
jgi:cell division protein FtsZ